MNGIRRFFGLPFFTSHWFVTTLIVIIGLIAYYMIINHYEDDVRTLNQTNLIVLVLSARDHFDKRDALRETWFKETYDVTGNVKIKSYFLVGKHECQIPMNHREDEYGCNEWGFNETEDCKPDVFSHDNKPISPASALNSQTFVGFSFRAHHDILLKSIGCLSSCHCDTIVLKNALTQEILLNQSLVLNDQELNVPGFNYQSVSPILFIPKGFIGLLISIPSNQSKCQPDYIHKWNFSTKLIQILRIYKDLNDYESQVFNGDELMMTSFVIELADQLSYQKMIRDGKKTFDAADKELNQIQARLENELLVHDDIILVDVIDVYRNLPKKLVAGIAWTMSTEGADLILKTDDDCFIDLVNISRKINLLTNRKSIWWGNFRRNMLVNIHGKWAEKDFPGSVYPLFACGSGYIISSDIANWITRNKNFLHHFQGEDVSMGIWLSSIIPIYLMDPDWACAGDTIKNDLLAYCQLNPSQLRQFYAMKTSKNQE